MSTTNHHYQYLAPNPKSSCRQLFIKGTRIRADVIHSLSICSEPMAPEEIAADYNLPVDAVNEAIAYCEARLPELVSDELYEQASMEARGMNQPDYKFHPRGRVLTPDEKLRLRREADEQAGLVPGGHAAE